MKSKNYLCVFIKDMLNKSEILNQSMILGNFISFFLLILSFKFYNLDKKGSNTRMLTLMPSLFEKYSDTLNWKIELSLEAITDQSGTSTGFSSLILLRNQVPKNGTCAIYPTRGYAMDTLFNISCSNWTDPDGFIAKYEYFGEYV